MVVVYDVDMLDGEVGLIGIEMDGGYYLGFMLTLNYM